MFERTAYLEQAPLMEEPILISNEGEKNFVGQRDKSRQAFEFPSLANSKSVSPSLSMQSNNRYKLLPRLKTDEGSNENPGDRILENLDSVEVRSISNERKQE